MGEKLSCFDCPCWECWRTDGFSGSRCDECEYQGCPHATITQDGNGKEKRDLPTETRIAAGLSDECSSRLKDSLDAGVVRQLQKGQRTRFNPDEWVPPTPGAEWTLAEHAYLVSRALAGDTIETIALHLHRKRGDVRRHAEATDVVFDPLAPREWCISCARTVPVDDYNYRAGFCNNCMRQRRIADRATEVADDEYEMRKKAIQRVENKHKQWRKRILEEYGMNPRIDMAALEAAFEEFVEDLLRERGEPLDDRGMYDDE